MSSKPSDERSNSLKSLSLRSTTRKKPRLRFSSKNGPSRFPFLFFTHNTLLFLCLLRIVYCSWPLFVGVRWLSQCVQWLPVAGFFRDIITASWCSDLFLKSWYPGGADAVQEQEGSLKTPPRRSNHHSNRDPQQSSLGCESETLTTTYFTAFTKPLCQVCVGNGFKWAKCLLYLFLTFHKWFDAHFSLSQHIGTQFFDTL